MFYYERRLKCEQWFMQSKIGHPRDGIAIWPLTCFFLVIFLLKFSLVDFVRSIRPFTQPSMVYVNFCWFYFWFLDFLSAMLGIYFFMSADGLKSRLLRDMLPHEYDENKNIVTSLLWQLNHQSKNCWQSFTKKLNNCVWVAKA